MYYKITYSTFSRILTAGIPLLLVGFSLYFLLNGYAEKGWILLVILVIMLICGTLYAPLSLYVDEGGVAVRRPLATKRIPLDEIASIGYAPPTMSQKRVCASGGFMGYWGWFHERPLGSYFAYYGRSSETFLVRLRNGKIYMLGCDDSASAAEEVKKLLKKRVQ